MNKVKQPGKTTPEEKAQLHKYYYKSFIVLDEVTEKYLKPVTSGEHQFYIHLSLIAIENHHKIIQSEERGMY